MNLDKDTYLQIENSGRSDLLLVLYINESGFAGILPDGKIVDRRIFPSAIPVQENKSLGIPKPKEL